ncbi:MAG: HAMP domain-containing sensor histidine kinase [Gaiellaceae bacterium]
MFRSLRFRLPALFLLGIVLSGLVSTAIAVRLFQSYTRARAVGDLRREATGLASLYEDQAIKAVDEGKAPLTIAPAKLQKATGDHIYYVGLPLFPHQNAGFTLLSRRSVDWRAIERNRIITFELKPPGAKQRYLAVAHPAKLGRHVFGAFVVGRPTSSLRARWVPLIERLALAFLGGVLVAGAFGWYLSRRLTRPVLALSAAADEVAAGRYEVEVPEVRGGDEIGHLSSRFAEMAERLREADERERHFLMTVSHELRTPLTAIRGHVEALREGVAHDPEAQASSLDVIAAEASRLERLVGDVLDLAKLDAHKFTVVEEEVDMERLVDRAFGAFSEEARRRRIDYTRDVSSQPVIVSDGDRVLQVISNLLANAFRWTPDGGRVSLELRSANGSVRVAVDDNGPGITQEERERIFRPFWSRDGGGTGLGLAIAQELALALGGRIELQSARGRGSRFELVLPTGPPF